MTSHQTTSQTARFRANNRYNEVMETRRCKQCGRPLRALARSDARYCSTRCRVAAHRSPTIPHELRRQHRWVAWLPVDRDGRTTKMPVTAGGRAASSTNPATWSTYDTIRERSKRLGYVLGDGVGCIDLDHAIRPDGTLTEGAQALVDFYPDNWIEISPSGDGLHIWGLAGERRGFRKTWHGQAIEFYSWGRFMTVTGRAWRKGQLEPL